VHLPGDYSCHATADLAQFNPGYSHEIGWVQGNRPSEKAEFDSPQTNRRPEAVWSKGFRMCVSKGVLLGVPLACGAYGEKKWWFFDG
jgi:hypothetical protein